MAIETLEDFAVIAGVELVRIDDDHDDRELQARASLEPGLLPPRPGLGAVTPDDARWV